MVTVPKKRRYDNSARAAAAEQTRERIMRAAYQLMLVHHFDDVTFARIAEEAGVSAATVTLHFKTREGLIEALLVWWKPQEDALRDVPTSDPLECARRIVARYEETGVAVMRLLTLEERVPAVAMITNHGRKQHRDWVERTFKSKLAASGRERRLAELAVAYDLYTWSVLRRFLDVPDTIEAMAELAQGVLDRGGKR